MKQTQMPKIENNGTKRFLYMAFELAKDKWGLGFSNGKKILYRTVPGQSMNDVEKAIEEAKKQFKLPEDVQIISCYEAGRDGFWLDRTLKQKGISNIVVDSASIEVNRKARRAKCDRMDAGSLVRMLIRYTAGEIQIWSVLHVPSPEEEDDRRLHRERKRLLKEENAQTNRIKSLLFAQGIVVNTIRTTETWLDYYASGDGRPLGERLLSEIKRELRRLKLVREQLTEVDNEKKHLLKEGTSGSVKKVRKLQELKGIGMVFSWDLTYEFLWRSLNNRREVGAASGLAPSSYQSGKMNHDLGISKAGNKRVRTLMIELSWLWLRYQPKSKLSQWYMEKFASGSSRIRKVGIVALARKLLIALWRWAEWGVLPEGALLKTLGTKPKFVSEAA